MKNLLFILSFFFLFSCSKKEEVKVCQTCTVEVDYNPAGSAPNQHYIESQTEYCNHEYDTIQQGIIYWKKTSNDGGHTFTEIIKKRTCK